VGKIEILEPDVSGMPARQLAEFMKNWQRWMHGESGRLGYPKTASGCIGGGYSTSFDDLCEMADNNAALAVDALVESLGISERAAVHHRYLAAVWRMRDFEASFLSAMKKIAEGLIKRGFW